MSKVKNKALRRASEQFEEVLVDPSKHLPRYKTGSEAGQHRCGMWETPKANIDCRISRVYYTSNTDKALVYKDRTLLKVRANLAWVIDHAIQWGDAVSEDECKDLIERFLDTARLAKALAGAWPQAERGDKDALAEHHRLARILENSIDVMTREMDSWNARAHAPRVGSTTSASLLAEKLERQTSIADEVAKFRRELEARS